MQRPAIYVYENVKLITEPVDWEKTSSVICHAFGLSPVDLQH